MRHRFLPRATGVWLILALVPANAWAAAAIPDRGSRSAADQSHQYLATVARTRTDTEIFALNVFLKNYVSTGETTILEGSWRARCRRVRGANEPTARCRLSWDSEEARWRARGTFRGAVSIGTFPYRSFRWRFWVTETCVGEVCRGAGSSTRVRRHLWKGRGLDTPA